RWARQRGAEEFDWRTIPDAPEPGGEMYGVYAFKRGFGGVARRALPTHDLVLRPAIYWPYIAMVSLRRQLRRLPRVPRIMLPPRKGGWRAPRRRAGAPGDPSRRTR